MKDVKDEQKNKDQELDDFWDISSLVPAKKYIKSLSNDISAVTVESNLKADKNILSEESTVIKRYINPLHYEQKKIRRESYEAEEIYYPENSLLHMVTLRKRKSDYNLYSEFYDDAVKYNSVNGDECEYVPYYSYVPQYNQLNEKQLSYYLWWRRCFNEGNFIKTDYSYVLLYVFELINIGNEFNAREHQRILCELWNVYHGEFAALSGKLAVWICDFSLLHRLATPENISSSVGKYAPSLKEFYLNMPRGDYESCAVSLIKYGTEYDYRSSKFAAGDNLKLFDKYIFGAVLTAVRFYSKNGVMLSELFSEDSRLIRNTFEGALCVSAQRYEIEVKYCSFSRSNELRYLMADIVKYAENKIRTYVGVKSKLTVYSVGVELQHELDKYFEAELFSMPKTMHKKEEHHAYDALYDLPKSDFSLDKAKQIENDSWNVTNDLISAFDNCELSAELQNSELFAVEEIGIDPVSDRQSGESELMENLAEYISFIDAVKIGDMEQCRSVARDYGKMIDAVIDEINEIAVEIIGDILIEEIDGVPEIIEYYRDTV